MMKIISNSQKLKYKSGFSLVELLIIIVIIGILVVIMLFVYNGIQARARDSVRDSDVSSVKQALELYRIDNGSYPAVGNDDWGYDVSSLAEPLSDYIKNIPANPNPSADGYFNYQYVKVGNDSYGLEVFYESKSSCKTGENIDHGWWGWIEECQ